MTYAALVQVKIEQTSDVEHRQSVLAQFVVPEVKKLPGFLRGMWLNDGAGVGTCVVEFGTNDQAVEALGVLASPSGPEVICTAVCQVEVEV